MRKQHAWLRAAPNIHIITYYPSIKGNIISVRRNIDTQYIYIGLSEDLWLEQEIKMRQVIFIGKKQHSGTKLYWGISLLGK